MHVHLFCTLPIFLAVKTDEHSPLWQPRGSPGCFCGDPEMAGWEITQKWASMSTKGKIIELFMGGFPA
jgi:hypothetical protein